MLNVNIMWAFRIILTFALLFPSISTIESNLCLVSSSLDKDHYYYPLDVYAPQSLFENEYPRVVRCSAMDIMSFNIKRKPIPCTIKSHPDCYHYCSNDRSFCPVSRKHVDDAKNKANTPLSHYSFCLLKEKLMNKNEVVNVYVTGGSVTLGSGTAGCCNSTQCHDLHNVECSWSYYFVQWMNRTFPAHINYINIAVNGKNSDFAGSNLDQQLTIFNIKNFTSNDLIFLDHSANDNGLAGIVPLDLLKAYVERLVRKFYNHSEPHSYPTIVLLDSAPKFHDIPKLCHYYEAYQQIAAYYNIPLWSYRITALQADSKTIYSKFLNYDYAFGHHPPWHVHLFIADIYAYLFSKDMNSSCSTSQAASESKKLYNRTFADLPIQLGHIVQLHKKLLDMSYTAFMNNLTTIGKYHSVPLHSWQLRKDGQRAGGFMREVDQLNHTHHDTKIVFTLHVNISEVITKRLNITVTMYYLRSYDNGGVVTVSYCGHVFDEYKLDALWPNKEVYKFSLPDNWTSKPFLYSYCEKFKGDDKPTLEFIHKFQKNRSDTQKFKIMSITAGY